MNKTCSGCGSTTKHEGNFCLSCLVEPGHAWLEQPSEIERIKGQIEVLEKEEKK